MAENETCASPPEDWGEPCSARLDRHYGVMTTLPKGDLCYSHYQGCVANMIELNQPVPERLRCSSIFCQQKSKWVAQRFRSQIPCTGDFSPVHLCDFEPQEHKKGGM